MKDNKGNEKKDLGWTNNRRKLNDDIFLFSTKREKIQFL